MGRMQLGAVFREPRTHTPPEGPRIRHATSNQSVSLSIDNGGITRAVRQLAKFKRDIKHPRFRPGQTQHLFARHKRRFRLPR